MLPFCKFGNCGRFADFKCRCQGNDELFCSAHLNNHLVDNSGRNHHLINIFSNLEEEDCRLVTEQFENLINFNKIKKSKLLSFIRQIESLVLDYINSLNNIDISLKFYYGQVKQHKRIFYPESISPGPGEFVDPMDFIHRFEFEKIDFDKMNLMKDQVQKLLSEMNSLIESGPSNNRYVYFFQQNTNILKRFDIIQENLETFKVEGLENQGNLAATCDLDSNFIFHYGGSSGGLKGDTFLIDVNNLSVIPLQSSTPLCYSSCEKINKRIFVFGGYTQNVIADSKYFNLKTKSWVYIASLPSPQYSTCAVSSGKEIFVSGHTAVYAFDFFLNKYRNIEGNIEKSQCKLLFNYKKNVLLISGNTLYSFDESTPELWINLGTIQGKSLVYTTGKFKVNGNFAYFSGVSGKVYRFNIEERFLETLVD